MAFSDHKIAAFTYKITDLPDQPNLPADELKARFDSSPEELRQAVNGICDDAITLSGKVDSILAETFDGVVEKSMLSEALADEIDAKAEAADLTAETTARESADSAEAVARQSADSALSTRVSSLESAVPQKARVVYGTYTGNGTENRLINVGFRPRLVIVGQSGSLRYYGMYTDIATLIDGVNTKIASYPAHLTTNGFRVSASESTSLSAADNFNAADKSFGYVAIGV